MRNFINWLSSISRLGWNVEKIYGLPETIALLGEILVDRAHVQIVDTLTLFEKTSAKARKKKTG